MTEPVPVRRIEVFTGAGQRRAWSAEDNARIANAKLPSYMDAAQKYLLEHGGP